MSLSTVQVSYNSPTKHLDVLVMPSPIHNEHEPWISGGYA